MYLFFPTTVYVSPAILILKILLLKIHKDKVFLKIL